MVLYPNASEPFRVSLDGAASYRAGDRAVKNPSLRSPKPGTLPPLGIPYAQGMAHPRKKHGERKDKKTARMRTAEELKHGLAAPERPTTDQDDVQTHKPGAASDRNSPPH